MPGIPRDGGGGDCESGGRPHNANREVPVEQEEFTLGILGLNRRERAIVLSLCGLSRSRDRRYRVVGNADRAQPQILVADLDDRAAVARLQQLEQVNASMPAVLVSGEHQKLSGKPYGLIRAGIAARLLKLLDTITIRELKYVPELVVGAVGGSAHGIEERLLGGSKDSSEHRPRVLVVDDSAAVRVQMKLVLELHELAVEFAEDAEKALQLTKTTPYHIIFLDIVLPEMDGYAACKRIKAAGLNQTTPIIMLTGKSRTFDRIRGVMAGCSRYVCKPIDASALRSILDEFLKEPVTRLHG